MSEMVERVARAICANESGVIPDHLYEDILSDKPKDMLPGWKFYVHSAVAAIEAMREPTEGMFVAGVGCMSIFHDHPESDMSFPKLWNHVIDEALKVKPPI